MHSSDRKKVRGILGGVVGAALVFVGLANEDSGTWATGVFFAGLAIAFVAMLHAFDQD